MTTLNPLQALWQTKPVLLLDGAMGTEIEARGVQYTDASWSARAQVQHPDIVQSIHADYLAAGADIISTNTFRNHARNVTGPAEARDLVHGAVALARAAVANYGAGVVAGSIGTLEDCYSPQLTPSAAACQREHAQIAGHFAETDVDVLLIETMNTHREAVAAAKAAHAVGLPFMVSFVLDEFYNLLSGESFGAVIESILSLEPAAVMVNCIPSRHMGAALQTLRKLTELPIGGYGNMATPQAVEGWAAQAALGPDDYCTLATDWVRDGAQIIGSCCGSGPSHTAALRRWLDRELQIL